MLRHPLVNSSRQLVVASPLLVLSLRPAPPSCPLFALAGCCVASQCTALLLSRHLVVPPLVFSSRQLVVVPSSLVILLLHCPLVLSLSWLVVDLHVLAPPSCHLILVHRRHHQTPFNAAEILNTSATTAIERRLYRPPLPQLPSITTVKCQCPPSSINAVKR